MQLTAIGIPPCLPGKGRHQIFLAMKCTIILLLAACLQVSANGHAQTISVQFRGVSFEKALKEVARKSGYQVFYQQAQIKQAKPVTISKENTDVREVLNEMFKEQPLKYEITNKTIVVSVKEEKRQVDLINSGLNSGLTNTPAPPPLIDISGRVTDEDGSPLMGASVIIKGTKIGTQSNAEGYFTLKGVDEKAILEVSYVGHEMKTVSVQAIRTLKTITLIRSQSKLDEVQIIGYGTTTQRYNVGSVSKVTSEEIASQPVGNVLGALEGRVPGLVVTSTSGLPGSAFQVQIRGQNSLNPTSSGAGSGIHPYDQPLFIIDGVPFAPQNNSLNQLNSLASGYSNREAPYGGISPMNLLNPSDIESIEILKDADATSIYGSRGANGVILITTKKGKAGPTRITANIYHGNSVVTRTMRMMNTQEYLLMRNEAFKNDNILPTLTNAPDLLLLDTTRYTDWVKQFLQGSATTTDVNISASGGNGQISFLLGAGYRKETFIIPGDYSDQKGSVNFNLQHTSTNRKLSIILRTNYGVNTSNSANTNGTGGGPALRGFRLLPHFPELLNEDGSLRWEYNGVSNGSLTAMNPLQHLKKKYLISSHNLTSNLLLNYKLADGLTFKTSLGFNKVSSSENAQSPILSQEPSPNGNTGISQFGSNNFNSWNIEPQLEYSTKMAGGRLNFLLGGTLQKNESNSTTLTGRGYTNDALLETPAGAATIDASSGYTEYRYAAAFGRINYILSDKYILNITGRRDGSSRFGPENKFGNFGSIGMGWIFSQEKLVSKAIPVLSYGKLRGSYGTTGSDQIGDYKYFDNWALQNSTYQGTRGYTPSSLFNPEYGWAVTKKLEFGLELGFFKDRLFVSSSWYKNLSGNQLILYKLPLQTGFSNVLQNFDALVQNTGVEFSIRSENMKLKNFNWTSSLNLSIQRNKLLEFPSIEQSAYRGWYVIGQPTSVIRKVRFAGVNATTGIYEFYKADGSLTYSPNVSPTGPDVQVIGHSNPDYTGGFRNTFSFKGIQLDVFCEFRKQLGKSFQYQLYGAGGGPIGGRFTGNVPAEFLNGRWQKPGDIAIYQQFSSGGNAAVSNGESFFFNSDGAYGDASFIRLKTVSLSYDFPKKSLERFKLVNSRIFLNIQNLFLITKYGGVDPETQSYEGVPPLRTVAGGIQLTF